VAEDNLLGNAGYAITGSGGGGSEGAYVFASLEELDDVIKEWTALRDAIATDGHAMTQASLIRLRPAEDEMSEQQSSAVNDSFSKAIAHNKSMHDYVESYILKLVATKKTYTNMDSDAVTRMNRVNDI